VGRPPLKRTIARLPKAVFFKPAGVRARELEQVALGVDEVEALRLVDLEGLSHEAAATDLGVSRQTVGRVLERARRKVADALVNGKAVVIGGGAYAVAELRICTVCGYRWAAATASGGGVQTGAAAMPTPVARVSSASGASGPGEDIAEACPACGSTAIRTCLGGAGGRGGRGGHGRGAGRGPGCAPGRGPDSAVDDPGEPRGAGDGRDPGGGRGPGGAGGSHGTAGRRGAPGSRGGGRRERG
jgi:predicted DNA-binding protein (UPF0251 family)